MLDKYFTLINLNLKIPGLQHQERAERGLQAQCVGHWGAEEDQALLEELL